MGEAFRRIVRRGRRFGNNDGPNSYDKEDHWTVLIDEELRIEKEVE